MGTRYVFQIETDPNQRCPGEHVLRVATNGVGELIVHGIVTSKVFVNTTLDESGFTAARLLRLPYFAQKSQFIPALLNLERTCLHEEWQLGTMAIPKRQRRKMCIALILIDAEFDCFHTPIDRYRVEARASSLPDLGVR